MRRANKDFSVVIKNLDAFLVERGWTLDREKAGLRYYSPPPALGLQKFSIALPTDPRRQGTDSFVLAAVDALSDLYHSNLAGIYDELAANAELGDSTTISVRFIGETTQGGSMPLSSMAAFLENIERSLYEAAKFKLAESGPLAVDAAERLTRESQFLQTERGSFIARVEVPSVVLRQPQLLPDAPPPIVSAEVCSSLFSAIRFLTERILKSDEDYETTEALDDALELFDATYVDWLAKMLVSADVAETEFSMVTGAQMRRASTGPLLPARTARLREYVKFIRDHLHAEDGIDVRGTIVELRSRDPEGNRNHVMVLAAYHGDRTFFSATLNNEQYQQAVDAHKNKREVRLRGRGLRLKTQVRITEVEALDIA